MKSNFIRDSIEVIKDLNSERDELQQAISQIAIESTKRDLELARLEAEVERLKESLAWTVGHIETMLPSSKDYVDFQHAKKLCDIKDSAGYFHYLDCCRTSLEAENAKLKSLFGEILGEISTRIKALSNSAYRDDSAFAQEMALINIQRTFETKLKEADIIIHASDCAVHNAPAMPSGDCNCQ